MVQHARHPPTPLGGYVTEQFRDFTPKVADSWYRKERPCFVSSTLGCWAGGRGGGTCSRCVPSTPRGTLRTASPPSVSLPAHRGTLYASSLVLDKSRGERRINPKVACGCQSTGDTSAGRTAPPPRASSHFCRHALCTYLVEGEGDGQSRGAQREQVVGGGGSAAGGEGDGAYCSDPRHRHTRISRPSSSPALQIRQSGPSSSAKSG